MLTYIGLKCEFVLLQVFFHKILSLHQLRITLEALKNWTRNISAWLRAKVIPRALHRFPLQSSYSYLLWRTLSTPPSWLFILFV